MDDAPRYDKIGTNYAQFRHAEPTWEAAFAQALTDVGIVTDGDCHLLNVGAGTGNYEDFGCPVAALEPSPVMIGQRPADASPCVQGVAEHLPFADGAFDAAMGVLTMHHWPDQVAGLHELARVSDVQLLTVYEVKSAHTMWLVDYFPETRQLPLEVNAPNATTIGQVLDVIDERVLWVPRDCKEGFAAASWARPHDYLDPEMQKAISLLALSTPEVRERGTERLRADLDSGAWHERYAALNELDRADFGYRLVLSRRRT